MICTNCEMYCYDEVVLAKHVCPEPYPRAVAESFVQMAEAMACRGSALIVHPRQKAAVVLGLKS